MELQASTAIPPSVIGGGLGAVQSNTGLQRSNAQPQTSTAGKLPTEQPSRASLKEATKKVQSFVESQSSQLNFSIDQNSGQSIVKVVDRTTQQVIRQIPSQEMLDIANALDRLQGLLVNNKA